MNITTAVFMDRDGTINFDNGYVHRMSNFYFIDHVIEAMIILKNMGFFLIVVTNQSGIARGLFTQHEFIFLTKWMIYYLNLYHVHIDAIYFCPHYERGVIKKFSRMCLCRKPNPGMLLKAKKCFRINMHASYMVGDTENDMLAGQLAGIGTQVLVCSGSKKITKKAENQATWVIPSLAYLPDMIQQSCT